MKKIVCLGLILCGSSLYSGKDLKNNGKNTNLFPKKEIRKKIYRKDLFKNIKISKIEDVLALYHDCSCSILTIAKRYKLKPLAVKWIIDNHYNPNDFLLYDNE